ncbi:hypothetical protein HDU78_011554 [Chytriomyces hyalinus]|nr:hypothetical protein HDU78_011554 [Chytriomyces hyalinus]
MYVRSGPYVANLHRVLKIDKDVLNVLDPDLVSQYNVKDFEEKLAGLLLSWSGFYVEANDMYHPVIWKMDTTVYESSPDVFSAVDRSLLHIAMCPDCWKEISGENASTLTLKKPVEAIANGNWIGYLPRKFPDISRTTESVVSLMQLCIYLSSVFGNLDRKTIKSHHYISVFDKPVLQQIPAMPWDHLRVTFVGSFATDTLLFGGSQ